MRSREKHNAQGRAYYRRHREEILKQKKAYKKKNRGRIAAKRKADYRKNKKRIASKAKEWKAKNPERYRAIQQRYRDRNKTKAKARSRGQHLKKKYGMTEAEYSTLLEEQGGGCAICMTKTWSGKNRAPVIDHDHRTGKARGILCHKCNVAIGLAGEDPERLEAMAVYIRATRRQIEIPAPAAGETAEA